jgi:hypothetical protein
MSTTDTPPPNFFAFPNPGIRWALIKFPGLFDGTFNHARELQQEWTVYNHHTGELTREWRPVPEELVVLTERPDHDNLPPIGAGWTQ